MAKQIPGIIAKIVAYGFIGIWITFWCAGTFFFDYKVAEGIVKQSRVSQWPSVEGRIARSSIGESSGGEGGTVYGADIAYAYTVNGTRYTSIRLSYGKLGGGRSSVKTTARRTLTQFPLNAPVTVRYDPRDPSQAVINTEIFTGSDLFGLMFLTPFNLIALVCLRLAYAMLFQSRAPNPPPEASIAKIIETPTGVRIRLWQLSPLMFAMIVAGGTAFCMIFIIGLGFGTDSMNASAAGWAIIIGVSIAAYRYRRSRIASGWYDLVLDDKSRTLTLPGKLKRMEVGPIAYDAVEGIDVAKKPGSSMSETPTCSLVLRWKDAQSAVLRESNQKEPLEALAQILRKRLLTKWSS